MTISEVREVLTGRFADEADRQYWVDKLAEMEIKEARSKENEWNMRRNRRGCHFN